MFDKDVKINPNDNGGTIGEHSPSDQFQADPKNATQKLSCSYELYSPSRIKAHHKSNPYPGKTEKG